MASIFDSASIEVTPEQAQAAVADDSAQLIDVREPYEWEAGRIDGARHVPLHELAELAPALDRTRPVVFACRVGGRSAMATEAFRRAGFEAYNLRGGVLAWRRAGLPFTGDVADH